MKQRGPSFGSTGCDSCPELLIFDGASASVSALSVISGRLAAQVTDGAWNAVVTTTGKGTFLIRRLTESAGVCSLRAYDVRFIPADPSLGPRAKKATPRS